MIGSKYRLDSLLKCSLTDLLYYWKIKVSYDHQDCIYLIGNTVKTVLSNIITI